MRGLNKVTLIGNLGNDPEFQTLDGEIGVAKFSLATTESFKDKTDRHTTKRSGTGLYYGATWPSWPATT